MEMLKYLENPPERTPRKIDAEAKPIEKTGFPPATRGYGRRIKIYSQKLTQKMHLIQAEVQKTLYKSQFSSGCFA